MLISILLGVLLHSLVPTVAYVVPSAPMAKIEARLREQLVEAYWQLRQKKENIRPLKLNVDVEVRESNGRGRGVFALRPIAAGELVGRYDGQLLREADFLRAFDVGVTSSDYAFNVGKTDWVVDAEDPRCSSWTGIINHSALWNCKPRWLEAFGITIGILLYATKPIQPGQELFYNYGRSYWDGKFGQNPLYWKRLWADYGSFWQG